MLKNKNYYNTAVIMAAGMGKRFGLYTSEKPKGFIEISDIPMIILSIQALLSIGINRIILGTGYKKEYYENLKLIYPQIECCYNPMYAETNSMFTLYQCNELIGDDDFILLESDIIYEKKALTFLLESEFDNAMLITPITKVQDQYFIEVNEMGELEKCSTNKKDLNPVGELVGIHKISNYFYKKMHSDFKSRILENSNLGYEFELLHISKKFYPLKVIKMNNLYWYEIDDEKDLKYAEDNIIKHILKSN